MTSSRLAAFWYALRHTSKEIDWVPPWRRHRKPCDEAFHRGYVALEAGDSATYRLETLGRSYCAHCDYIELFAPIIHCGG